MRLYMLQDAERWTSSVRKLFEDFVHISLLLCSPGTMAVVELKVGMHCERCIKAIKKAIKTIDDMESYQLETEMNKVTVTGNVTPEEVVKALHKIGKTATCWTED
ncbi:copper transport protein ATX1-like [Panicum virgatum]|uniref:copper transport protein ATX1-like n=1 Tax=Panicum virgatum TaxID=38727 RepID=UPI0019D5BBD2|nr:copper transport protein ATX1-like [Panicum virgatum]